jgi:uncharacterized protein
VLTSVARIETDVPERYAKQLVSHLARKAPAQLLPDGAHQLALSAGLGTVRVADEALVLVATAADERSLAVVEDVLGRHLMRFGARRAITVRWTRSPTS